MKRTLCLILLAAVLSVTLIACGNDKDNAGSKAPVSEPVSAEDSSEPSESSEETSTPVVYGENIPVIDFEKATIRVLTRDWANSSITYNGEIIQRTDYDEEYADSLDVQKYKTRVAIEEKYNCKIEGTMDTASFDSILNNQMMSGSETPYHIVFDTTSSAALASTTGLYKNLFSIASLNGLTDPWWEENSVKELTINNKLYFVNGDINTFDNDGTFILFYNKQLLEDTNPGVDVYKLVRDGEWTIDKFTTLIKNATFESSGDATLDEFDNWGFGTECYNAFLQVLACGRKLATKDADDIPELSYRNESYYTAVSKVYALYNDPSVMVANDGRFDGRGYTSVWEETTIKAFRENRELFYMGGIFNFTNFREIDFKYGFLPVPMLDETQDRYYHFVSTGNSCVMAIPASLEEDMYEKIGTLVQALGAAYKNEVTPVYYDQTLKGKSADTDGDEEMLDVIFNSRTYDIGAIFNWGNIVSEIINIKSTDFVSRFKAIEGTVDDAMEETISAFEELD